MRVFVRKLNGDIEPFREEKLENSLRRAGASEQTIDLIMEKVKKILFNSIETSVLFDFVFNEFSRLEPQVSQKYNLKKALLSFGNDGFVFEKFVAKILEAKGYSTELDTQVKGKFVTHEIDILAQKEKELLMVECKYHKSQWITCSIQTALYVYARFLDLKKSFNGAMLATNTKFSSQAIAYSDGVGLLLFGWNYPPKNSLAENIEKFRLYPVTMLSFLSKKMAFKLLENDVLLIKELAALKPKKIAGMLGVPNQKAEKIIKKSEILLYYKKIY